MTYKQKVAFISSALIFILNVSILLTSIYTIKNPSYDVKAASNGLSGKPYMGWSSWSLESTTRSSYGSSWLNEGHIKQMSDIMQQKLQPSGYDHINLDSFWASGFDGNGRPTADHNRFPSGIASLAAYVHSKGQKLGVYYIGGLNQSVYDNNSPIIGTTCHAQDIAYQPLTLSNSWRSNYAINWSNPCSQAYINSLANQFASWGIDFLKLDGITPTDYQHIGASSTDNRGDVAAWSKALKQTGRPIWLTISWSIDHNYASYWTQYANGIRIDTDVECYCNTVVTWDNSVKARFSDLPQWLGDIGPNSSWADLDSVDIGAGSMDGINSDERQTVATLWSIASAPFYSGDDLTQLDSYGISLLTNQEMIAVDQSGIAPHAINSGSNNPVYWKQMPDGTRAVALFNLNSNNSTTTVNWSDIGVSGSQLVHDMWSHTDLGSVSGSFSASIPSHGSRLLRIGGSGGSTPTNTPKPKPTNTPGGTSGGSYEAESPANTIVSPAKITPCSFCSGGSKVGYLGKVGTLKFNDVTTIAAGTYTMKLYYIDGDASASSRSMFMSVNGGGAISFTTPGNGNWSSVQSMQVSVNLKAGANTILFSNTASYAADIDRIVLQ